MSYNIIYSSSNEYSPYLITSMYSLLKNNPELNDVKFWILTHDMLDEAKLKITNLCAQFNASFEFIDCRQCITEIFDNGATLNFNPSSFLRIFIPQLIPEYVEKALFIDSDTYINHGIKELYDTDISEYFCAMSYNVPIYKAMIEEASLNINDGYFNAGVILLNLSKWRAEDTQKKILDYYYSNGGNFPTDDQSVINAIVNRNTKVLDYKYNAMIIVFYCSYKKFCRINTPIGYMTKEVFNEAKKNPVIVHFNGPGIRPWEKCCGHPYTSKYRKALLTCNPNFQLLSANKSLPFLFAQYIKHAIFDKIECFFNK